MRKSTVITSYENPDLDGVSCMIAYGEFLHSKGIDAQALMFGLAHEEARYVMDRFGFAWPATPESPPQANIVLVDYSYLNHFPETLDPKAVVEVFDHRKNPDAEKYFPNAKIHIEAVGACATLIAEKFRQEGIVPSTMPATLLGAAIISNTLNFQGNVTTARDREMAAWLEKFTKLPENFAHEMFLAKSDLSGDKLHERIDGDFAWFDIAGKKVGIAQIEMIGAEELVRERQGEILRELEILKVNKKLDYIFCNIIDLENVLNVIMTGDRAAQELAAEAFGISFSGVVAIRKGLLLRKEMIPLLGAVFQLHPASS